MELFEILGRFMDDASTAKKNGNFEAAAKSFSLSLDVLSRDELIEDINLDKFRAANGGAILDHGSGGTVRSRAA